MSEQSGPITREQVERAIDAAYDCNAQGVNAALGAFWYEREDIPADVRDGWRQVGYLGLRIALTRWRDELTAAEREQRVARWDATRGAYVALDAHGTVCMITTERAQAIDWGYDPEGGPEPVRDWKSDRAIAAIWPTPKPAEDSPERLRERREGIPWTLNEAAAAVSKTPSNLNGGCVPWQAADVSLCEGKSFAGPAYAQCRALYAAALSAEEARRAAVGAWAAGGGVLHYSPPTRFKVGDWVRVNDLGSAHHGHTYQIAEIYGSWHRKVRGDLDCSYMARNLEPASPPAPEVVDVPQPAPLPKTVAHFYTIRALPEPHRVSWNMPGDGPQWVRVNDSLWLHVDDLRAMLADIDAQQGGAS